MFPIRNKKDGASPHSQPGRIRADDIPQRNLLRAFGSCNHSPRSPPWPCLSSCNPTHWRFHAKPTPSYCPGNATGPGHPPFGRHVYVRGQPRLSDIGFLIPSLLLSPGSPTSPALLVPIIVSVPKCLRLLPAKLCDLPDSRRSFALARDPNFTSPAWHLPSDMICYPVKTTSSSTLLRRVMSQLDIVCFSTVYRRGMMPSSFPCLFPTKRHRSVQLVATGRTRQNTRHL